MNDQKVVDALLRDDLRYFIQRAFALVSPPGDYIPGWHMDAIVHQLMRVFSGEVTRLIINIPPRYGKSIAVSIAWIAWMLGHDPTRRIICVSYSNELAQRLSMDTREVMESEWFKRVFPEATLRPSPKTQSEFWTTQGGYRLGVSTGGSLTGRGGNLIVVDDPSKADDVRSDARREEINSWFRNTLLSRLDNKCTDAVVLVMQRLHADDLTGSLLESGGWTHLCLPAIAEVDEMVPVGPGKFHVRKAGEALHPERESLQTLSKIKKEMGSTRFEGQYQQRPVPPGGGIVKWTWFQFYERPLLLKGGLIVQSWDTAFVANERSDWSVCTTWLWHEERSYLLDIFRARMEYPAMRRKLLELAGKWNASQVIVEKTGAGISLIQEIRRYKTFRLRWHRPQTDKATRLMSVSPFIEAGLVYLQKNAPWLEILHDEVVKFPKAKHDDIVDSLAQYLIWVEKVAPGRW